MKEISNKIKVNKVSRAVRQQAPTFIANEHPQIVSFLEYYYKSQEKTGLSYNILNNLNNYLNIDEYDLSLLDSGSFLLEDVSVDAKDIVVEDVYGFVEENGTIKIGDEIIFYEKALKSASIALTDGISLGSFTDRWVELQNLFFLFDSSRVVFPLTSGDQPINPSAPEYLVVKNYNKVLQPGVDYTIQGSNIVFTQSPRVRNSFDNVSDTSIFYLKGFTQNPITTVNSIQNQFDGQRKTFSLLRPVPGNLTSAYEPVITEYTIVVVDDVLLRANIDYSIYKNTIILKTAPPEYATCFIRSIEAPIASFGTGASAVAKIVNGEISKILPKNYGSGYRTSSPPKVTISGGTGANATAISLVSGISKMRLISEGSGYSSTNPPKVIVESPTNGKTAVINANVENGKVTSLDLISSGSNYTFIPRVSFRDPGGAEISRPTVSSGSLVNNITVTNPGFGYTTPPRVYIDPPTLSGGIQAVATATLNSDGTVASVNVSNLGTGYTTAPRVAIIDPTLASVLEVQVDALGRVIEIELLNPGVGFIDIPSIYIIDERRDAQGQFAGGRGATAVASIFNGGITDITITNFGSGYSADNPPKVIIQRPPSAAASVEIAFDGITDFEIIETGSGYTKSQFTGCARGVAGPIGYDERGNVKFLPASTAIEHRIEGGAQVYCLDGLFLRKMLTKYIDQFLPDLPKIDIKLVDVNQVIKNIREFYRTKGTSRAVSYLFKILYGEDVSVSYPREQIIKPSSAIWSVNTILRAYLISGNSEDLINGVLTQTADLVDTTIGNASALIENYLTIQTSSSLVYELIVSAETFTGKFSIPYKTRLAEGINETDGIITVDSTIGWPERNGEIVVGDEVIQYKEKSLNQFIECTRSKNDVVSDWDAGTIVQSNFKVYVNKGLDNQVELQILGIAEAGSTTLSDTGSYYLSGDKLSVARLGSTSTDPKLTTWVYNVKKLLKITSISGASRVATAYTETNHGLLVGDSVTLFGANPIVYNGKFSVISINPDNKKEFQYTTASDTGNIIPQGNILVSIDLNKGKSTETPILNQIKSYTTNVQNAFFDGTDVYVASTGLPNYPIGPFGTSALTPGNQRKLNRFPFIPQTISTKTALKPGPIGTFVNGVSVWSYISNTKKIFGPVTSIDVINSGSDYDADNSPVISIESVPGQTGSGARATVVVNGSLTAIEVTSQGSGYVIPPLISIVGGGGGSGAAATAIISAGRVSQILVTAGGTGYTSRPLISISGGSGSGAAGEAKVRGPISKVVLSNAGASYSSAPIVNVSSGSGAICQAIVSNGRIISIAVISAGSGYTTAPNVFVGGTGFGAVAKAVIDTDGENAGRVTSVDIVNRGIGYTAGTTTVDLVSVGSGATFTSNVFEWTYNLQEQVDADSANGFVFEGYNTQYGGEYAHVSNPQRLRYVLGDSIVQNSQTGNLAESDPQTGGIKHSPIIGWAFDGNPIYGPFGYSDPTNQGSPIQRMLSSYSLLTNVVYNAISNPVPSRVDGPSLAEFPSGYFVEDYEYIFDQGDLDQYNGRFCKTPDFPLGTYAYFTTIEGNAAGTPVFPYFIGSGYNSIVDLWNLSRNSVQQNIPTSVIRYRDPFIGVDIDVPRSPNVESDFITTEDGDILLFDAADDNGDGIVSASETANPGALQEEDILELYDYFPRVQLDSRVDIEVQTTTRFEDAQVSGFLIENPGNNYQVKDRLVFDNTDTNGDGVSAAISTIRGKTIESYTYETIQDVAYGVVTTEDPHDLIYGDEVEIEYEPELSQNNSQLKVRVVNGIENIIVEQVGTGYNEDVPIQVSIDGNGIDAVIRPVINSQNGTVTQFEILNSGQGFTSDPRILISHPQSLKKADYYLASIKNQNNVKINDTFITTDKLLYVCGETLDSDGNTVGFVAKYSSLGTKSWSKTLSSNNPVASTKNLRLKKLVYYNSKIYVVGESSPNITSQASYNPDVLFARLDEAADGLSASVGFVRGIAGISGNNRADFVDAIAQYSDNRFIIGGSTNTNSLYPNDAYVALVTDGGEFVAKRKIASTLKSESVKDFIIKGTTIYALMEVSPNVSSLATSFAIVKLDVQIFGIELIWTKEYSHAANYFKDVAFTLNEYDEIVVTSTLYDIAAAKNNSFWIGKFDIDGTLIWNYRTLVSNVNTINTVGLGIDIFGQTNLLVNKESSTNKEKSTDIVKFGYDGRVVSISNTAIRLGADGMVAGAGAVDSSGDVYIAAQTYWNRNELLLNFDQTQANPIIDVSGSISTTPTLTRTNASGEIANNRLKFYGVQTGTSTYAATYLHFANATYNFQEAFGSGNTWTLDFFAFLPSARSSNLSQTRHVLFGITNNATTSGGVLLAVDQSTKALQLSVANNTTAVNSVTSITTTSNTFVENRWYHVAVTRNGNLFTVYLNGVSVLTATVPNVPTESRDLFFGNVPVAASLATFNQNSQFSGALNFIRLRNRSISSFDVPSDIASATTENYVFTDTVTSAKYTERYDYISYFGTCIKTDKDNNTPRLGTHPNLGTNFSGLEMFRSVLTANPPTSLSLNFGTWTAAPQGNQLLDFTNGNGLSGTTVDAVTLTYAQDVYSSRTATVPALGSSKVKVSAKKVGKFFIKTTSTQKIDNIQKLTINQSFSYSPKTKLVLKSLSGAFINSGYITEVDPVNRAVYVAINSNDWSNDLNTGVLSLEQFSESAAYGIVGPVPNNVNLITQYYFPQTNNTTPGTFDITMASVPYEGGTLDNFASFRDYSDTNYSVRIDESTQGSIYPVGSVVSIPNPVQNLAFIGTTRNAIRITGLSGVLKITLIATLDKRLTVTAVTNTDSVYVITERTHYLSPGSMIYVEGNPTRSLNSVSYDEYDGAFSVYNVISSKEFVYKLKSVALTLPSTTPSTVEIYSKSPVLKMFFGHQYEFDVSHPSMVGYFLSFSQDNLNKLEYSFNSILRIGTPGVVSSSSTVIPKVQFKVTRNDITSISYYFDPSKTGLDSPVNPDTYIDVTDSPYVGRFKVAFLSGATITRGPDVFKFPLINEPEGPAIIRYNSQNELVYPKYETYSEKVAGKIGKIRLINGGGFYTKLPIVSNIISSRKIERVLINDPGTEYEPGTYSGVPILGDGEGGLVSITVEDGQDSQGNPIPGQISSVVVTSAGKGYTSAYIDIPSITGILGADLGGSGAELLVDIPPFGSTASIFTTGSNVGKIKKLKNNNFGYDYPHDYTLRPEITFPINAQLVNTSILTSITVTNPGSGYSQAPSVIISGGGGSGAVAEAFIRNGRINEIIVKDPGSGYSSEPIISLKSAFNYVVNLDLGLLQFSYPHGIVSGSKVQLQVASDGNIAGAFPIAAGAIGTLNASTVYYAISGIANSLEPDQLKLAITPNNASLGDAISFVNVGAGRQIILTDSFGGSAIANVGTGEFLAGEYVYQGDDVNNPTAYGYVSGNGGWEIGPRLLKIIDYTGNFELGGKITGNISKSSGIISTLSVAKGVLQIDSVTKTTGQFEDERGKLSEIIQRVQDSYYYQTFSYAIQSSVSITSWRNFVLSAVHPAGFALFGQLNLTETAKIENKTSKFELIKSVNLSDSAIVPNVQNFALVEPIYTEYDNTQVLFRQRRLTSSENILTSVVQRLDDISSLFDGQRIAFPLTITESPISPAVNQLMIVLNGVVQSPGSSFEIQGNDIVFAEPPQAPASVRYGNADIDFISTYRFTFSNVSGIFPTLGNSIVGLTSRWRGTVIATSGNTIDIFYNGLPNTALSTLGGLQESEAAENGYIIGETYNVGATGFIGVLTSAVPIRQASDSSDYLFQFGETVSTLGRDLAQVETINLSVGQERPIANLRFTTGGDSTSFQVTRYSSGTVTSLPVLPNTFVVNKWYQFDSEIFQVQGVVDSSTHTTLTVLRGQLGTQASQHQSNTPIYGTEIVVTNTLTLSKTVGTYQSKPGLFDIRQYDIIIGAQSGVVAFINRVYAYVDPVTGQPIGEVIISEGSSFFGLVFSRISTGTYSNVILDNLSESQIQVNDLATGTTSFDINFPIGEFVNNHVIVYSNPTSTIVNNEFIRNYKFSYGNESGPFLVGETSQIRQLAIKDKLGGYFNQGQIIRSSTSKAEVLGFAPGRNIIYLGKTGRGTTTGADYHTAVFNNGAQLDNSQKRFGTTSAFLDGANDYISLAASSEFGFGTDSFTVETWVRLTSLVGTQQVFDFRTGSVSDLAPTVYVSNGGQIRFYANGSDRILGSTLNSDTWYHIALCRAGGFTRLYVNGTRVGSTYTDSNNYGSSKTLTIGARYDGGNPFGGHFDEFRVSNISLYTTDIITLQTGIYQGDANTKLLLHFDGVDNATSAPDWSGAATWSSGAEIVNTGIPFRFYDAANEIENNIDLIAKEAVYITDRNFPRLHIPSIVASNKGADSHDLLLLNLNFIAWEAYQRVSPASVPSGTTPQDCVDDVKDIIRNIAYNLKYGFNSKVWDAAKLYVSGAGALQHITGQVTNSVNIFIQARNIAKEVINNTTVTKQGTHVYTQTKDPSITFLFGGCVTIESAIDNLVKIVTDTVQDPDGTDAANYPSSVTQVTRTHPVHAQCTEDLKLTTFEVIKDIRNGGNKHTWDAAAKYVNRNGAATTLNHVVGEEAETAYAYGIVKDIATSIMRGTLITIQGDHGLTQVRDTSITIDPAGSPYCADVASAIDVLYDIVQDTITTAFSGGGDYLGTLTRTVAPYEYAAGKVYATRTDDLTVRSVNPTSKNFWVNEITPTTYSRFIDAAELIQSNSEAIVDEAAGRLIARYPQLATTMPRNQDGTGSGTQRCKTDLSIILGAIVKDLSNGGNRFTTEAAKSYLGANDEIQHIQFQLWGSLFAHKQLGEMSKLAITGDLAAAVQYTDTVVVSDTGVTQDAGGCANVKSAIDNLITTLDDILAPSGDRYKDAADLLIFNTDYIAEEAIGLLEATFFYQLGGSTYRSYEYPGGAVDGRLKCIRDAKLIVSGIAADLLTGGNNATLFTAEKYLDSQLSLDHVEDQLAATIFAWEKIAFLCKKAISNLLQSANSSQISSSHYVAEYTTKAAIIDSTITHDVSIGSDYSGSDCADVQSSIDNVVENAKDTLAPGGTIALSSARILLFNKNYYDREISEEIRLQWGSISTSQRSFIEEITDNIIHDLITTKETVIDNRTTSLYSNVQTYKTLTSLLSTVDNSNLRTNLIPAGQTETLSGGAWNDGTSSVTTDAGVAPDGTTTADKFIPANDTTPKELYRDYILTSYATFDRDNIKFDSTSDTFDQGVDASYQRYTYSIFFKSGGYTNARIRVQWDATHFAFFNITLTNGTPTALFSSNITGLTNGVIPYGDGWFRAYISLEVPFGVSTIRLLAYGTSNASETSAGDGTSGVFMWGAKFAKESPDIYVSQSGKYFYPDNEYNVKNYILSRLSTLMQEAVSGTLTSPSPETNFLSYTNSTLAAQYTSGDITAFITGIISQYQNQLLNSSYYLQIGRINGISLLPKTYGTRNIPVPLGGLIEQSSFAYGTSSDNYLEIGSVVKNQAQVAKSYVRLRVTGITNGPFLVSNLLQKQGAISTTGVVYGLFTDENFSYVDMEVTAGTWSVGDVIISTGGVSTASATISQIQPRIQVIGLEGEFIDSVPFKAFTSNTTATNTSFLRREGAVINNTGGRLTIDTESLVGNFETTSVVFPQSSRQFLDVIQYAGTNLRVGDTIVAGGYVRYGVVVSSTLTTFVRGGILYGIVNGTKDVTRRAIIVDLDLDNGFIYAEPYLGTFVNGQSFGYYGVADGDTPVGFATIATNIRIAGNASGKIVDLKPVSTRTRIFVSDIRGTWSTRQTVSGRSGFGAMVFEGADITGRVKRAFRGFDGAQTDFKLTTSNGTPYFPDPQGHLMIFVNGILQPVGADNAYTAFSDTISFAETPEIGSSFVGFYIGKLRQLDDISFEFDSLRQSFNMKRQGTFYSITLTDGVQSAVIRPENNIIVSLNGVIQEPGIGFTIVGSRIIFSEIPRVGSTFVAYSYVGSEADVDAAIVVPPVEPGDLLDIDGETSDREVAVIESSNSLITVDYLGSVFGKGANAEVQITKGRIREARVTSGGSGYTSRPLVRIDSVTGFDGNIKALVGIERIEVVSPGSGYKNPLVVVETTVDDTWVAENLSSYGADGTINTTSLGSGVSTEPPAAAAVLDNSITTSGGITSGGGVIGQTTGGTDVSTSIYDGEAVFLWVRPAAQYSVSNFNITSIFSSSST